MVLGAEPPVGEAEAEELTGGGGVGGDADSVSSAMPLPSSGTYRGAYCSRRGMSGTDTQTLLHACAVDGMVADVLAAWICHS